MQAADSAQVESAKRPPPAWLERIAPGTTQRAANTQPSSPALRLFMMVWGVGFAILFFAGIYGFVGWGAGMLLGFAIAGRWPGSGSVPGV